MISFVRDYHFLVLAYWIFLSLESGRNFKTNSINIWKTLVWSVTTTFQINCQNMLSCFYHDDMNFNFQMYYDTMCILNYLNHQFPQLDFQHCHWYHLLPCWGHYNHFFIVHDLFTLVGLCYNPIFGFYYGTRINFSIITSFFGGGVTGCNLFSLPPNFYTFFLDSFWFLIHLYILYVYYILILLLLKFVSFIWWILGFHMINHIFFYFFVIVYIFIILMLIFIKKCLFKGIKLYYLW